MANSRYEELLSIAKGGGSTSRSATHPQRSGASRMQELNQIASGNQGQSVQRTISSVPAAQPTVQETSTISALERQNLRKQRDDLQAQITALQNKRDAANQVWENGIYIGENKAAAAQYDAQIKALQEKLSPIKKQYLDTLKKPTIVSEEKNSQYSDTTKRNALLDRLNNLQEYAGWATDDLSAENYRAQEDTLIKGLHEEDSKLGYAARDYNNEARLGHMAETAGRGILSAGEGFIGSLSDSSMADPSTMNELQRHRAEKNMELARKMYGYADENDKLASEASAQGKEGLGAAGRFAFDVGVNAIQTGADALAASTGAGMVPFFVRAAGGSMNEARREGANARQAVTYGMARGAVEVLTEKLFDGLGGVFGAGAADDVVDSIAGALSKSDAGRTAIRAILNAVGEGSEEAISDFADPLIKMIYDNGDRLYQLQNDPEAFKEFLEDTVYDFAVGAAMSVGGNVLSTVNGQNAARNRAIDQKAESDIMGLLGTTKPNARQVDDIVKNASRQQMFQDITGVQLEGGIGNRRRTIKEFYRNLMETAQNGSESASETTTAPQTNPRRGEVNDILNGGRVSNTTADRIVSDPELASAFTELTGIELDGTAYQNMKTVQREARARSWRSEQANRAVEESKAALSEHSAQEQAAQTRMQENAQADADVRNSGYGSYVRGILRNGATVREAQEIIDNPEVRAMWEQMTGKTLPESRNRAVDMIMGTRMGNAQIPSTLTTENIDNAETPAYNNSNDMNGGVPDAGAEAGTDAGAGVPGQVRPVDYSGKPQVGNVGRGNPGLDGTSVISEASAKALEQRGIVNNHMKNVDADSASFASAMAEAVKTQKHGASVDLKTAEDIDSIVQNGGHVFMAEDGSCGCVVTADGDIEAVFKNSETGNSSSFANLMIAAIENGGRKLDCYGPILVRKYAKFGFKPVAQVDFNPEYAQGVIGEPQVYAMYFDGGDVADVIANMDNPNKYTQEQLDALPRFNKDGYDDAIAYRDMVMPKPTQNTAQEPTQRAPQRATQANNTPERAVRQQEHKDGTQGSQRPVEETQSEYDKLKARYGVFGAGEKASRESDVPTHSAEDSKVSQSARTVMEAEATPEKRLGDIKNAVVDGKLSHIPVEDADLASTATKTLGKNGWEHTLKTWTADVRKGKVNAKLVAMGATLLNEAGNSNCSGVDYIELLTDYVQLSRAAGQALQAMRILKTLSPEGKLYMMQKSALKLAEEIGAKNGVEIDPELADAYKKQTTDEGRDAVTDQIIQNIADQLPATLLEKWTAWRYLSMLGNLKTQGRNLAGNGLMYLARAWKDKQAAVAELLLPKEQRTKSFVIDAALRKEAKADFKTVAEIAKGEGKYKDSNPASDIEKRIQDSRTIFKLKPIEGARKLTNWAMETGDEIFLKQIYSEALAGYLQARGVKSMANASQELLDSARSYAIKEAQEATFRDTNQVSAWVSKIGRGDKSTTTGKVVSAVAEGVLPFRKTPANVAVRAVEYSPLGLAYNIGKAIKDKSFTAETVNGVAKGATGTELFAVGLMLAAQGLANANSDDDDDKLNAFNTQRGLQKYSIKVGDKWFSLSQFAPMSIPFFMGVRLYELTEGGLTLAEMSKLLGCVNDPMLEMSFLSGINDALSNIASYGSAEEAVTQFILNSLLSYVQQGLTNTLIGQIEQAGEEYRMTNYTDSENPYLSPALQKILSKASAKVPGFDYQQQEYFDAWGRKQGQGTLTERVLNAFLNPTYYSDNRSTEIDAELERLYRAGKEKNKEYGVLPQKPNRSTKVDKEKLSPEEYMVYAEKLGQDSLRMVSDFVKSTQYKGMTDDERSKVIADIYSFAKDNAANKVRSGRKAAQQDSSSKLGELSDVMSSESAAIKMFATVDTLEPKNGAKNVSASQKVTAVLTSDASAADKMAALGAYTDGYAAYNRAATAQDKGYTLEEWAAINEKISALGSNPKKEEIVSAFENGEEIYQIYKNPTKYRSDENETAAREESGSGNGRNLYEELMAIVNGG